MDSFSGPSRKKRMIYSVYPENLQVKKMPKMAMIDLDRTIHKYSNIDDKAISIKDGDWTTVFDVIKSRIKYKV